MNRLYRGRRKPANTLSPQFQTVKVLIFYNCPAHTPGQLQPPAVTASACSATCDKRRPLSAQDLGSIPRAARRAKHVGHGAITRARQHVTAARFSVIHIQAMGRRSPAFTLRLSQPPPRRSRLTSEGVKHLKTSHASTHDLSLSRLLRFHFLIVASHAPERDDQMASTTTTFMQALFGLCSTSHATPQSHTVPLTVALNIDVLTYVFSFLDPIDLAACARVSRDMYSFVTPTLYAHVAPPTYTHLDLLVRTLETSARRVALDANCGRPALGSFVRSFTEQSDAYGPYLFLETQCDAPPPHLLGRLLRQTPNLRALQLESPIEIDLASEVGRLSRLTVLELGDATRETIQSVLPAISRDASLRMVTLTCLSAGWSSTFVTPPVAALAAESSHRGRDSASAPTAIDTVVAFLARHSSSLSRLNIDHKLMSQALPALTLPAIDPPAFPHLGTITLHVARTQTETADTTRLLLRDSFPNVEIGSEVYDYSFQPDFTPLDSAKSAGSTSGLAWARLAATLGPVALAGAAVAAATVGAVTFGAGAILL